MVFENYKFSRCLFIVENFGFWEVEIGGMFRYKVLKFRFRLLWVRDFYIIFVKGIGVFYDC